MALTLKTTGIASIALAVVAVDEDNTVKDFVVGNNESVTAVSVGSGTWGGVSRRYFETLPNGPFNYFGVAYTSAGSSIAPATRFQSGFAVYAAFNAYVSGSHFWGDGNQSGWRRDADGRPGWYASFNFRLKGTTTIATGTKFSFAGNYRNVATSVADWFYGLESSTLSIENTTVAPGVGTNGALADLGGVSAAGYVDANWHVFVVFASVLTTAQFDSLHSDWFNVLLSSDGSVGGGAGSTRLPWWARHTNILIGGGPTLAG